MKYSFLFCLSFVSLVTAAQQQATVKEYTKVFTTYPFSDPGPVPDPSSKIYPYFRYDGFTETPVQQSWKVVELRNDYISVIILPEIGGKIWTASVNSTGKDFLYNNHVVKFRDVAMRGPWTSGGIEANYGIIGHTPNCATPVDYTTVQKPNGSVSCIIGVLDLLTQTEWRLDINLPADKAYFTTQSTWHNGTPLEQPYYTWMNTGIKAAGNLEFIYPGTHYIGHEGEYSDWPVNKQNGKQINWYNQNDFGGYKSYHVTGTYTDFFGAYWHDDGYGMARYSTHDDKAGKKIWIWGLSQQGMIWEKLLSDTDGQYVEVQSGRLFNQSAEGSMYTPFKYRGFAPGATDTWTEYWFPVVQTRGFVKANASGALNAKAENGWLKISFCPVEKVDEDILIIQGTSQYKKRLALQPLQNYTDSIRLQDNATGWTVAIGSLISYTSNENDAAALSRPIRSPADFDWNSVYGLYTAGRSLMEQRHYAAAEDKIRACLQKDKHYAPALVALSELQYRRMMYLQAFESAAAALAINTYDPAANYHYALAAQQLGKIYDARDGFDIAAQSAAYRVPAFTQLAYLYFREKNYTRAADYAEKSLVYNTANTGALQLLALISRITGNKQAYAAALQRLLAADPLNHYAAFDQYVTAPSASTRSAFLEPMNNEMPSESCMQLAEWYFALGCTDEIKALLGIAPDGWEMSIWRQYFSTNGTTMKTLTVPSAFPFRSSTASMLHELRKKDSHWKLTYALALIHASRNNMDSAAALFKACGNLPDDAAFYAARAGVITAGRQADLEHAIALDPEQWRYHKSLAEVYISEGRNAEALAIASAYYNKHNSNFIMGMLTAKALLLNKSYSRCDSLLARLHVIPFEGATDGRELYRETKLMLAAGEMEKKQYKKALQYINASQQWPEQLGVGKPYDEDIDARLENWMLYHCYTRLKRTKEAAAALQKIPAFTPRIENTVSNFLPANHLVTAWVIEQQQGRESAIQWLKAQEQQFPNLKKIDWCISKFTGAEAPAIPEDANMRILNRLMLSKP